MIGLALKAGITAFGAAGVLTKLIVVGSIALSLVATYGVWHYHVWSNGYDKALSDIASQDKKAVAKATSYRNVFLECRTRGLRWDQSTGKCGGG